MRTVIWTEHALTTFEQIILYISHDSDYYAKHFAQKIIEHIELLSSFPESGRIVPEYDDPVIREIIYRNYRIVYHLKEDSIALLYLGHAAKKLPDISFK